jgi:hypothetical protein
VSKLDSRFPIEHRGPYRGQYAAPQGRLVGDFDQLQALGCIQCEMESLRQIFARLMVATAGNPCDSCPVWTRKGPACEAFQQCHTAYRDAERESQRALAAATTPANVPKTHPLAGLSVKQIAAKLNISLGEVRRRKAAGTL